MLEMLMLKTSLKVFKFHFLLFHIKRLAAGHTMSILCVCSLKGLDARWNLDLYYLQASG